MDSIKRLEAPALLVMLLGALNWGILGIFGTNVIAEVFGGGSVLDVAYAIVGVAGLVYLPRVMEMVGHLDSHVPHTHGS